MTLERAASRPGVGGHVPFPPVATRPARRSRDIHVGGSAIGWFLPVGDSVVLRRALICPALLSRRLVTDVSRVARRCVNGV